MRMCGDVHRLFTAQPPVSGQGTLQGSRVLCGSRCCHLGEQRIVQRFVPVKVDSRVVRPMKKPQKYQRYAANHKNSPRNGAVLQQTIFRWWLCLLAKMPGNTEQTSQGREDHQQAA